MAAAESKPHEIVILGGNLGGVNVAHYLLRHTIPALKKLDGSKNYRVTMVSPSTHLFWKIGAPRALINKELIPVDTVFKPIQDGLSAYTSGHFSFIQGIATSLSAPARTVTVTGSSDSSEQTISYDSLIISTGTTSNSALWTLKGDHALSQEALNKMHAILPNAKTIVVAGGGAVGVETSGEIAAAYPDAKVTLLSGSSRLLERAPLARTGKQAEDRLNEFKVDVVHNLRVKTQEDAPSQQVKLHMDDGSERVVDLYIDATGGKPNTDYVPRDWLNEQQRVTVDGSTMRVRSAGSDAAGVYALGDAADYSNQTYMYADAAVAPVCSSLGVDVAKMLQMEAKAGWLGSLFGSGSGLAQKTFSPVKDTMIVPVGRKGGVGSILGFQAPSLMVYLIKGRTYFTEQVPKTVNGELRAKA
ncbi:MAG: hypothetical protein LQ340_004294 [Diploschistes diacapsis]|nr:MAG: hypothetical protein LQ340_004294 [Diploschistes diacapsis]